MHKPLLRALFLCLLATPAAAQTATATGTGVGVANSRSQSGAVAISGQGGQGGNSNLTVNGAANPAVTSANVNQNLTGTSTVRNVPAVFAPGLSAAGLETCLGSVSGGGSVVGFGATFGTSIPDPGCNARLDARTLWSMGLKKAAVARLCLSPEINRSMPEVCAQYLPSPGYYGSAVAAVAAIEPPVELIDRRTGAHRWCDRYDEVTQRCRAWAGEHKKMAAAMHPKPKRAAPVIAVQPAETPVLAEPPKEN